MATRLDDDADYRFFAKRLASFEPVKALDQYESFAVSTDLDRRRLTVFYYALGKGLDRLRNIGVV